MRLFVALEIPAVIRKNFVTLIEQLRAIAPELKWVRAENLHLTLKFIGETSPEKMEAIRKTLATIRSDQSVNLQFRGLGFFPNDRRPRVFWAGMEASANLKTLAADIDSAVEKLGFPREQRPFTPHLTLARFNDANLPEKLHSAINENAAREFGSLNTNEFHLIESKLKPSGAEYTILQSFPFAAEP